MRLVLSATTGGGMAMCRREAQGVPPWWPFEVQKLGVRNMGCHGVDLGVTWVT
jgi:hypothetical protein